MEFAPIRHVHLLRFQPGDRRGQLTIVRALGSKRFGRGTAVIFLCTCDCGAEVQRDRQTLIKAGAHSCDACRRLKPGTAPEGATAHPLYKRWDHMIERCTSPANKSFRDYGARGIKVCERWLGGDGQKTGFECFVADMGPMPAPHLTIERSNTDGHYEPGNCSWANRTVQNRNRRSVRMLTIAGRTQAASAWAAETGVPYFTLMRRLQLGWPPERAVERIDGRKVKRAA